MSTDLWGYGWREGPEPTARLAMPAPLPSGITFHHHPDDDSDIPRYSADETPGWDDYSDYADDELAAGELPRFSAPAVEARHHGDYVGHLEWDYEQSSPVVNMINVHPDYRRHGIGTALFDYARQHEPDLQHSDSRTALGEKWVSHEQSRTAKFDFLDDLAAAGYVTDEWSRWQGGGCLEYAHALLQRFPHLSAGALYRDDGEFSDFQHHFAHDDTHAYDSAGSHPLPYHGVEGDMKMLLNDDLDDYDDPDPDLLAAAHQHIERNGIGPHTAARLAMPAPLPQDITFRHETEPHRIEADHNGQTIGYLRWENHFDPPTVDFVRVHPDYQRHGIATALWDRARQVEPRLQHSNNLSEDGKGWVNYEQSRNARLAMPMHEIPQFGHQLPHVGPLPGADPNEGHVDNYWVAGGCGELALAFKNMFPDLKIGAEITKKRRGSYYDDDDSEDNLEMAHVWVHDGTHAHDGFGTHVNAPDAWAGSHGGNIDLDVDPQRVADSMGIKWSPDDDGKWSDPNVSEAADEIEKHWFNRHYNPETGEHQDHPYKEAKIMTAAVTVYTQPNCVQCTMTKKQLDKLGVEHTTVDVSADPDAHAYVTGLGYTAAPVVVVGDGEEHWAGFRSERLKELAERLRGE